MTDRFAMDGRVALITGGSLSIGRALALAFAEQGADIAIHHAAAADDQNFHVNPPVAAAKMTQTAAPHKRAAHIAFPPSGGASGLGMQPKIDIPWFFKRLTPDEY